MNNRRPNKKRFLENSNGSTASSGKSKIRAVLAGGVSMNTMTVTAIATIRAEATEGRCMCGNGAIGQNKRNR